MKETCCQLGPEGYLSAILTEPFTPAARATVVLVSAGLTPKEGPFRLYAELARRLALAGFSTLRFDLGGIGDSQRARGELPLAQRTAIEIREAVDFVSRDRDPGMLVLGGLCSGAEDSFRFAGEDRRIGGVFMIDPFAYRTRGWRWRDVLRRATRRGARALGVYRPLPARAIATGELVTYAHMPRVESSRILRDLLDRGARVHFVYTAGMSDVFNHERQLGKMFDGIDLGERVTLDHLPHVDHTQMLAEHRRVVVEAITARLTSWSQLQSSRRQTCSTRSAVIRTQNVG